MANGHGGRRFGAGRKPKSERERLVHGNTGHRGRLLTHPRVPLLDTAPPVIDEFDAPDTLMTDERHVWLRQAPYAFRNGTLTRASALSFERYCRLVVREQAESKSSGCDGPNHRGMQKQLNALELQFGLTAAGKPMADALAALPIDLDKKQAGYW